MNPFRRGLVQTAFKTLDKQGTGLVSIDDIKGEYNAALHPDVVSRKKNEDEILTAFLDSIEQYYTYIV